MPILIVFASCRYEKLRNERPILSYWQGYSCDKENELQQLIQGAGLKRTKKTTFVTAENMG